jgi:hypothetical protein
LAGLGASSISESITLHKRRSEELKREILEIERKLQRSAASKNLLKGLAFSPTKGTFHRQPSAESFPANTSPGDVAGGDVANRLAFFRKQAEEAAQKEREVPKLAVTSREKALASLQRNNAWVEKSSAPTGQAVAPKVSSATGSTHANAMKAFEQAEQARLASSSAPSTTRERAMASLERRAEKAERTHTSSSQRSSALRSFQEAETMRGASASLPSTRSFARGGGGAATTHRSGGSVAAAKFAFARKAEAEEDAREQGGVSQMQAALRGLHKAGGTVSAQKAFGIKSKKGTQHAAAMANLNKQTGEDLSVGGFKRPAKSSAPPPPKSLGAESGGMTARERALASLGV